MAQTWRVIFQMVTWRAHVIMRNREWISHRLSTSLGRKCYQKIGCLKCRIQPYEYVSVWCLKAKWTKAFLTRVTVCSQQDENSLSPGESVSQCVSPECFLLFLSADQAHDGLHWAGGQREGRRNRCKGKNGLLINIINNKSACFLL